MAVLCSCPSFLHEGNVSAKAQGGEALGGSELNVREERANTGLPEHQEESSAAGNWVSVEGSPQVLNRQICEMLRKTQHWVPAPTRSSNCSPQEEWNTS